MEWDGFQHLGVGFGDAAANELAGDDRLLRSVLIVIVLDVLVGVRGRYDDFDVGIVAAE